MTMRNGSRAVLEPVCKLAALLLVADVPLPLGTVLGAAGRHHFHHVGFAFLGFSVVVLGAGPIGAQFTGAYFGGVVPPWFR